jgi:dCMP deaminase
MVEFIHRLTYEDFGRIARNSWSKETMLHPEKWDEVNPAFDQCVPTAALAQDVFGGIMLNAKAEFPSKENPTSHYFNLVDGKEEDFSREQFPEGTIIPAGAEKKGEFNSTREYALMKNPVANDRYELFKERFKENIDIWDDKMDLAWEFADYFASCKKMKFGAVLVLDDEVISTGYNHSTHPNLAVYCEPNCIREGIPSGTHGELYPDIHAEADAIFNAYQKGHRDLSGAEIYVAGKFSDGRKLVKDIPSFYCTSCVVQMSKAKINRIIVPSIQGEAVLNLEEVIKSSFDVATGQRKAY